jgi:cytochrome c553
VGSVAAGKRIVSTGAGKTQPCALCHGPEMKGIADFPPLAGRSATYLMRQLWDVKQGTRLSVLMKPVVEKLSADDLRNVAAYLVSLQP